MFENEKKSGFTVKANKFGVKVNASVKSDDITMLVVGTSAVALIDAVGPAAAGLAADGIRGGFRLASKGLKAAGQAAKAAVEAHRDKVAVKKAAKAAEAEKQKEADQ